MELLEWDAQSYDALPLPHERWGVQAIERLGLAGDETVLDLGCGTGRDAGRLLDALPAGRVVAVDGSEQMLAELRTRLRNRLDRVSVVHADIREPLHLDSSVDAVLSVATLHWLPDHAAVFRNLASVLRPGGRLVAEAGGAGNIEDFRRALAEAHGDDGGRFWNFAGIDETAAHLRAAGFRDVEVELVPDPARLEPGEQLKSYLATVMLGPHLREVPPAERPAFVRAVAAHLTEPVIDYVRLQIRAVRN
jgi:trans-aconitate 2-methyltransferase